MCDAEINSGRDTRPRIHDFDGLAHIEHAETALLVGVRNLESRITNLMRLQSATTRLPLRRCQNRKLPTMGMHKPLHQV
jgi:hypothetical protein